MAVYALTKYPKEVRLADNGTVCIRPMEAGDGEALLAFFRAIPEEERDFLHDDVASEAVISSWTRHLDYDRILPLLAMDGDKVCADVVLIRRRSGARSHAAEVRLVVGAEYRNRGLGSVLLREAAEIAWDSELDCVQMEIVEGVQDDAISAVRLLGAVDAGVHKEAVKDRHGNLHNLVFMHLPLGRWWTTSQF